MSYGAIKDRASGTVGDLLLDHLVRAGKTLEAAAFRRIGDSFNIKVHNYSVRDGRKSLGQIIDQTKESEVCTITRHSRLEDIVLVISVDQLATDLGGLALKFETSVPSAQHPNSMFAAVDRLPRVSVGDVEIDVGKKRRVSSVEIPD